MADMVVAKLDAPDKDMFRLVNRPAGPYSLPEIVQGIKLFRSQGEGLLALQMMFIRENRGCAALMAKLAEDISPDEVQINTPLRECAVDPLPPGEIAATKDEFKGLGAVVTAYEGRRPRVAPLDTVETFRRRPGERPQKKGETQWKHGLQR